jgi:hypothetical protein
MSPSKRGWLTIAAAAAVVAGSQSTAAAALADPTPPPIPSPTVTGEVSQEVLHNIAYRARVDGVSRGATITYAAENDQTLTATPTMLPGRVFEANTVLPTSKQAQMRVSIEWPYSANLHCEILVDDVLVAQADDFIAPRVLPVKDDPDYGALTCEAPVSGVANAVPGDTPPEQPVPDAPVDNMAPPPPVVP